MTSRPLEFNLEAHVKAGIISYMHKSLNFSSLSDLHNFYEIADHNTLQHND